MVKNLTYTICLLAGLVYSSSAFAISQVELGFFADQKTFKVTERKKLVEFFRTSPPG
jgi:hypothetical protein